MDEALDFREAQKRLQFVNATVNLAADSFDRVRTDSSAHSRALKRTLQNHEESFDCGYGNLRGTMTFSDVVCELDKHALRIRGRRKRRRPRTEA